jgi:hypothetical protein
MKELENHKENKIEIVAEQEQRKEIKLIGQQRKVRGLILWEYNTKTLELREAQFKSENVSISSLQVSPELVQRHSRVVVNENCIYIQALNRENAGKKVIKWVQQYLMKP